MKLKVWISTDKIGSKCSRTIAIDDRDLEGEDEQGRQNVFEDSAREEIWRMAEWGYEEVKEG